MVIRRRAIALSALVGFLLSVAVSAQQAAAPRKLTKAEEKERDAVYALLDPTKTATPPNDLSLAWVREDILKSSQNQQYVPFILSIDPSKTPQKSLTVYWRVVSTATPPAPPADAKGGNNRNAAAAKQVFVFEQINAANVTTVDGVTRISRAFQVLPGNYDVWVIVKEPTPEKAPKNAPPVKASVIKKNIDIPDLWNGELTTSSVFVGRIDPLPAPLTPQQQMERPYAALGTMEITPDLDTKYTKKGELSTFMLIYNAQIDSGNKPDITIEYNFYAKAAEGEKFFNKTNPQNLNAQTLPPAFDVNSHQLQAGQAVPLASFPEGDYRLEIKVTDKLANKSITRNVNFSVAGS